MRIERNGQAEPLTPRIEAFLKGAMGGVSLDDVQHPSDLRADYACLRGLLAVELKTLEEDGSERMDNLLGELRERDDWPMFLGSAPIQSFIDNTNDPDGLRRRTLDRIGRGIINHLKKANRQLEAHAIAFPRRNTVRALILVNEDHEAYDPYTVGYVLWQAVRRMNGDRPLYEHVDFIAYFTQRHAQIVENRVAFPTLIVEGQPVEEARWKSEVAAILVERWAAFNDAPLHRADSGIDAFETIDVIPERMTRSDAWRLAYRREPYLRGFTKEQLRDFFDEVTVLNMLWSVKGCPISVPKELQATSLQQFTHVMMEMAQRAIPITEFSHTPEREAAAARRVGLPDPVLDWLAGLGRQSKPEDRSGS